MRCCCHPFIIRVGFLLTLSFQLVTTAMGQVPAVVGESDPAWLVGAVEEADEIDTTLLVGARSEKKWEVNTVSRAMLLETGLLYNWQVEQFFAYKKAMGDFKDLYELQAIPGWDPDLVRKMFSYLIVSRINLLQLWRDANHQLSSRITIRLRGIKSKQSTPSNWLGSPIGSQLIYSFRAPSIQAGLLTEKDPGEKWFDKKLRTGVDFLSFHVTLQTKGVVKAVIIGDYTVNMGQGLLQWQSFAFKKTPQISSLKKTGAVFRPYRNVGEFNFHRGVAISLQKKQHGLDYFVSSRLLSVNMGYSALAKKWGVTSFNTNGYHRTFSEISKRNNFQCWTSGLRYQVQLKKIQGGINAVTYFFSSPLVVTEKPYDRYSINDNNWWNASIDLSYQKNNWHFYFEQAIDKQKACAGVYAILLSLSRQLDIALVTRLHAKRYQSLFASSFTESSSPGNEQGLFLVVNANLSAQVRLQLFQDYYRFPWLRYTINQPSIGVERYVQLQYLPSKSTTVTVIGRMEQKFQNVSQATAPGPIKAVTEYTKQSWRFQWQQKLNSKTRYTLRLETSSFVQSDLLGSASAGFLAFLEWHQQWSKKGPTTVFRGQYFDMDNSQSAIYVFLPSIGSAYQLSQFAGRGENFILIVENEIVRKISARAWISYEPRNLGEASPFSISLQIAMKLH
jgi:hypothetical protein